MKIGAKLASHVVMNCGDLILWSDLGPTVYKAQNDRCQSEARLTSSSSTWTCKQ
ncbi:unnamed protein product [Callosobruchus maculatus]|uniref:Uncharacterized protein n=1 Tax=Callosobruchus maculatus TaxID=64391 RepID=A0A653C5K4_CALMS|nr:unnamed protein product [Callosobruchus maculatus]